MSQPALNPDFMQRRASEWTSHDSVTELVCLVPGAGAGERHYRRWSVPGLLKGGVPLPAAMTQHHTSGFRLQQPRSPWSPSLAPCAQLQTGELESVLKLLKAVVYREHLLWRKSHLAILNLCQVPIPEDNEYADWHEHLFGIGVWTAHNVVVVRAELLHDPHCQGSHYVVILAQQHSAARIPAISAFAAFAPPAFFRVEEAGRLAVLLEELYQDAAGVFSLSMDPLVKASGARWSPDLHAVDDVEERAGWSQDIDHAAAVCLPLSIDHPHREPGALAPSCLPGVREDEEELAHHVVAPSQASSRVELSVAGLAGGSPLDLYHLSSPLPGKRKNCRTLSCNMSSPQSRSRQPAGQDGQAPAGCVRQQQGNECRRLPHLRCGCVASATGGTMNVWSGRKFAPVSETPHSSPVILLPPTRVAGLLLS